MRIQAGLKPEDWRHWGESSTFKENAADLLRRELRPHQIIYCSPLTDPYQPAESVAQVMPGILEVVRERPPAAFVIQTRGPLIIRDLALLRQISCLRISFSVTTDREDVRRTFESRCAPLEARWEAIGQLRKAGIAVSAALAPLLPCDPEQLLRQALEATEEPVIADGLHVRAVKPAGATTREAALAICRRRGWLQWLDSGFQTSVLEQMSRQAHSAGRPFGHGPAGFSLLTKAPGNFPPAAGVL
jgi:DNA repair photolyase